MDRRAGAAGVWFGGVLVLALAAGGPEARAGSLFVDDDGCDDDAGTSVPSCAEATGTSQHPYRSIAAAAVAASDATRFNPQSTVVIHVAAGDYHETSTVELRRAKVRVVGATRLPQSGGFPDEPTEGGQTVVHWLPSKASSILVAADDVRIEGLTFRGPGVPDAQSNGLAPTVNVLGASTAVAPPPDADLIDGVLIRGCAFLGGRVAVLSTHANLTVEGNFATGHFNGMNFLAGPAGGGQSVVVRGNRVVSSQAAAIIVHGQSGVSGRAGEQFVEVYDNDFSHNGRRIGTSAQNLGTGVQIFGVNAGSPIPDANQSRSAYVSVDVHDNVFTGNRNYGVTVNDRAIGTFTSTSTVQATIEDNTFCGNGNNDVIVASIFFYQGLCPLTPSNPTPRHLAGLDWQVTLGPDVGWDYIVGAGNTGLTVDGSIVNTDPGPPGSGGQPIASGITPWPAGADMCNVLAPIPAYSCPE